MNIIQYGYTQEYGYGFLREAFFKKLFDPRAMIYTKSCVYDKWIGEKVNAAGVDGTTVLMETKPTGYEGNDVIGSLVRADDPGIGVRLKGKKDSQGRPQDRQCLFVVLNGEDEQWYEYFTGLKLMCTTKASVASDSYMINNSLLIDLDRIDSLPIGINQLSISTPTICDAVSFRNRVNSYTKYEIQEMVRQISSMQQDARKWGMAYGRAVNDVRSARIRFDGRKDFVEADIASGFARYAKGGGTQQDASVAKSADGGSNVDRQSELHKMWLREGKCIYCGGILRVNEIDQIRFCRNCGNKFSYK